MNRFRLLVLFTLVPALAADHQGLVRFAGVPVPGATVTATNHGSKLSTVTDPQGVYRFSGLADGAWTIQVDMQLFNSARKEVAVSNDALPAEFDLTPLPSDQIAKQATIETPQGDKPDSFQRTTVTASDAAPKSKAPDAPKETAPAAQQPQQDPASAAELAQRAADGFLINGSVNNGASSPFAQLPAFGNNRRGARSLYNGNLGLIVNNSSFDARAYSLTGQNTPKPAYNRIQGLFSFGGPIRIPGITRRNNGPNFTVNYQWTRNSNANTQTGLMPTLADRAGDFSGLGRTILDPTTGAPFPGNRIPAARISQQARNLFDLYPLPNFDASSRYNFQLPIVSGLHQDDLQTRASKQVRRNNFSGSFAWQSTRTDTPDLFGFLDTGRVSGLNSGARYRRTISARTFFTTGLEFSRQSTRVTPYFSHRRNVSAEAGITGNNQDAVNWGPPAITFASGISPLVQQQASLTRNQTTGWSADTFLNRGRHNLFSGITVRKQQFNLLSQQDARGTFAFTGATAGYDLAGFLLGVPDTSSIAFGNADKYLRATTVEAFVNDDFRVNPGLTINAGLRWEYWSPLTEKYGRLVNLETAPGFSSVTPQVANQSGSNAFPQPDRNNLAPRVAFSWRPLPASSLVIRGGYGIYYDTSVYLPIATQMAQQAPLSRSLRVANSPETPLTLAQGFPATSAAKAGSTTTFAVDPRFRIGYAQTWQMSIQRDLPAALQMTAGYTGSKGTRSQQQLLPNTFPNGALDPAGFTYLMSNGNSTRHAGQLQIRRRLRSGLTASLGYTWAKSLDNSALGGRNSGGALIAQNWLDLQAERGRSNFDQRHLITAMAQYTTGMGVHGGALASGWRAVWLKDWTFGTQINAGSGLPLTPVLVRAVQGTGVTGSLRPDYTGAALYDAPSGFFLNPAAYAAPASGSWGNAGRNSITGPRQFSLNASISRTFRSTERLSYDFRIDAANALNTVTFPAWNTVTGNAQFGLPNAVNPMRTVQATIRMRF